MRSSYKPPLKKKFFHTRQKVDKNKISELKNKKEVLKKRNNRRETKRQMKY
jgi:hypothetical protein